MSMHLQRELHSLKKEILKLGTMVEDRFRKTITAIETNDIDLAIQIIRTDYEIDHMEVEIEEECLKILALHQPVASDLRFIIAVIKINNDLERVADQAVNIARRVKTIAKYDKKELVVDYGTMAEKTGVMLNNSLDALVNLDAHLANNVRAMDDEIDLFQREVYEIIKKAISKSPENVGYLINQLLISRHLERTADHATNIAEEVIYMVEGEIVRHKRAE